MNRLLQSEGHKARPLPKDDQFQRGRTICDRPVPDIEVCKASRLVRFSDTFPRIEGLGTPLVRPGKASSKGILKAGGLSLSQRGDASGSGGSPRPTPDGVNPKRCGESRSPWQEYCKVRRRPSPPERIATSSSEAYGRKPGQSAKEKPERDGAGGRGSSAVLPYPGCDLTACVNQSIQLMF